MITIISGPQGSGKGRHAAQMKEHGDTREMIEEWNGKDPLPADCIVTTNLLPYQFEIPLVTIDHLIVMYSRDCY